MGHRLAVLVMLLATGPAVAGPGAPAQVWLGAAPSGACVGDRVVALAATGALYCCVTGAWASCGGGSVRLDQVTNPTADKTFAMVDNHLSLNWVQPVTGPSFDGAFEIQASGAFSGDLLHLHQHTGNPGAGTDLAHFEWSDADVTGIRLTGPLGTDAISMTQGTRIVLDPATGDQTVLYSNGEGTADFANPLGFQLRVLASATGDYGILDANSVQAIVGGNKRLILTAGTNYSVDTDQPFNVAKVILPTCASGTEGWMVRQRGETSGTRSALCVCTSDGAASPAYAWKNVTGSFSSDSASLGTATTCPSASTPGTVPIAQGGTTQTASTEDAVLVGSGTTAWQAKVLPSCSNATTSKLLYDSSTNAFSCGTDQTGGGGVARTVVQFMAGGAFNSVNTAPTDPCTVAATNLGTSYKIMGVASNVTLTGFTTARIVISLKQAGVQTGLVECKIRNLSDSTDLVYVNIGDPGTACTIVAQTASISVTGQKWLYCSCKDSVSTDDPLFGPCVLELE